MLIVRCRAIARIAAAALLSPLVVAPRDAAAQRGDAPIDAVRAAVLFVSTRPADLPKGDDARQSEYAAEEGIGGLPFEKRAEHVGRSPVL